MLALLLAYVGVIFGAAFHWLVVDLSDDELLAVARTVRLSGYAAREPGISEKWAPSFDRGRARSDIRSVEPDEPVDADRVVADLSDGGWSVTSVERGDAHATVGAVQGRAYMIVNLSPYPDRGTQATIAVGRRPLAPNLPACLLGGALFGALIGAWWGWRLRIRLP